MKIGTPLPPTAKRVMLLGAGELGKEVIIALQRLGVARTKRELKGVSFAFHLEPPHHVAHALN